MLSLRRKDIVCQEAVELVTDYLEGTLSRRSRRRFESHLRACPNCSAYLEQIRITIEPTGRVEPDELSPDAKQDLIDLYRRWRTKYTSTFDLPSAGRSHLFARHHGHGFAFEIDIRLAAHVDRHPI